MTLPGIGLDSGGTYEDIVARASENGLSLCDLEVAPHLRLQFRNQPQGPYLTVASPLIRPDDDWYPNGLYLRTLEDGSWLVGYEAGAEVVHPPDFTDWVFTYLYP